MFEPDGGVLNTGSAIGWVAGGGPLKQLASGVLDSLEALVVGDSDVSHDVRLRHAVFSLDI